MSSRRRRTLRSHTRGHHVDTLDTDEESDAETVTVADDLLLDREVIDLTCPTDESFVDLTSANESSFVVLGSPAAVPAESRSRSPIRSTRMSTRQRECRQCAPPDHVTSVSSTEDITDSSTINRPSTSAESLPAPQVSSYVEVTSSSPDAPASAGVSASTSADVTAPTSADVSAPTSPNVTSPTTTSGLCPVCMESYKDILKSGQLLYSTMCGHVFCKNCISGIMKTTKKCATCRHSLACNCYIHPIYI